MNNSKIWLVVNPTVGVPIFLGAVAVGSFAVHVSVLTNTTWVSDFLKGQPLGSSSAAIESQVQPASFDQDAAMIVQAVDQATTDNAKRVIMTFPDGRTAYVVIKEPDEVGRARRIGRDAGAARLSRRRFGRHSIDRSIPLRLRWGRPDKVECAVLAGERPPVTLRSRAPSGEGDAGFPQRRLAQQ